MVVASPMMAPGMMAPGMAPQQSTSNNNNIVVGGNGPDAVALALAKEAAAERAERQERLDREERRERQERQDRLDRQERLDREERERREVRPRGCEALGHLWLTRLPRASAERVRGWVPAECTLLRPRGAQQNASGRRLV